MITCTYLILAITCLLNPTRKVGKFLMPMTGWWWSPLSSSSFRGERADGAPKHEKIFMCRWRQFQEKGKSHPWQKEGVELYYSQQMVRSCWLWGAFFLHLKSQSSTGTIQLHIRLLCRQIIHILLLQAQPPIHQGLAAMVAVSLPRHWRHTLLHRYRELWEASIGAMIQKVEHRL